MVLPLVLVASAVLLLAALGVADQNRHAIRLSRLRHNSAMAYYAAEAGVQRTRYHWHYGTPVPPSGELYLPGSTEPVGSYTVQIEPGNRVVVSGRAGAGALEAVRILRATVKIEGSAVTLQYDRDG